MFEKCRSIITRYRSIRYLNPKTVGEGRRGFYDKINDISRLCVNKINIHSETLRPFLRQCSRQIDYVTAQRCKRGQQWIRFYSQLWTRDRLSALLIQMGRRIGIALRYRRISTLVFSGAAFSPVINQFDDDKIDEKQSLQNSKTSQKIETKRSSIIGDTISDELITSHTKDLLYIQQLKDTTLTCEACERRHVIDEVVEGVEYCRCDKKLASVYGIRAQQHDGNDPSGGWVPFLERKDILVWRREHPEHPGLFAYKMYGKFDDVSAKEFLEVQMDVSSFRMSWDISTAQCNVILEEQGISPLSGNGDNLGQASIDTNQIYYWEVNWPRFFSNRDYVCARRASVFDDEKDKAIVVYTRSTEHPSCPEKPKNFRVKDYWSVMVIKPFTNLNENGIEFSLTAFENPGLSLPSSITTWVAIRGMPEFMENLRKACFQMRKWKIKEESDSNQNSTSKSGHKTEREEPSYMETPIQYSSQQQSKYSNAYV